MFGYRICPLATEPLASWLTDFRDWTGSGRRAAFVVFRKNFSPASREHILERIRLRRLYSLISEILSFRNPIVLIKFSRTWQLKTTKKSECYFYYVLSSPSKFIPLFILGTTNNSAGSLNWALLILTPKVFELFFYVEGH